MQNPLRLAGSQVPRSRSILLLAGAVFVVAMLGLFAWIQYANTRRLVEATDWVEHTLRVSAELEAAESALKDAEIGQSCYLLTGLESCLEPYEKAREDIRVHTDRIRSLTADNPSQQSKLEFFQDLARRKLDELAEIVRLTSEGDLEGARRAVVMGIENRLGGRLRRAADDMRLEEAILSAQRSERARSAARRVLTSTVAGALAFLGLLVSFLILVYRDAAARARAAAEIRESEAQLRTTLSSIGDAVLAADTGGLVTFLNPVAEQLTGWPASDAVGRPVEEVFSIINDQSRFAVESPVRRVLREGVMVGLSNHTILITRDGAEVPIADSGAPIRDDQGSISGVILVFRSIAEQRRAERSVQRLAAIVASSDTPIIAETLDNVITDWNPGAEALFAFSAEEMIGHKMAELAVPDSPDPSPALTRELLTGRRTVEFDARRRTKGGEVLDVAVSLSPIRASDGTIIGVSRLVRDVTERRRQRAELVAAKLRAEEANAAKDRFLATLSHELRTPLTPVMASVHRLERRPDLGAGVGEALAMIRRNIELEARLIDDLLDLTRIARGKVELELIPLDLHAILAHVIQGSRSEFLARRLELSPQLGAEDHYCVGDGARLQQVFWNLLKNSVKFTPSGGRVTLKSENPAPGRIRVRVTDTGQGIRPELLPRMFEAFEQGDVTAARRAGGLGLGLAIARNLVEMHHGSITATSEGEGRGASFVVELPTTLERPEPMPSPGPDVERFAARKRTPILVVEDDADTRTALHDLLAEAGFDVRVAGSIAAARAAFRDQPVEVLVTDLGLPDGSGFQLLGALKAIRPALRAIVLSGYGMDEDVQRSLAMGFSEHLVKPLNLNRLIAAIDRLAV